MGSGRVSSPWGCFSYFSGHRGLLLLALVLAGRRLQLVSFNWSNFL